MGPVVLKHRAIGPIVPEQEGSGPAVLRHKVDTLVSLGRRGFVLGALGQQDSEPVDPGQEDFSPIAGGFDLDLVPTRVDLADMYTRVASAQVGFVVARADIAVAKFGPGLAKVGPETVWVERYEEHITSVVAWPAAIVTRIDLAVVVGDLATG